MAADGRLLRPGVELGDTASPARTGRCFSFGFATNPSEVKRNPTGNRVAGLIPQSFVDELLRRVDIVELVDEYVPLKRKGRDHGACCPFHDEKTPSFTVSSEKQFYYCFGCQASGSALGFLMNFKGLGFVEAVEELADRLNLEVPREGGQNAPRPNNLAPLYELLEDANRYFQRMLREHPDAVRAVSYLKDRGLTGEIAAKFQLGFAPPGWDNTTKALGTTDARREALITAGLSAERGSGNHRGGYDRFRDRIMFPIRDNRGRVVGFGGRILEGEGPKYLNSPETPVFHKGRELYGLYQARRANAHPTHLLVVEGYMDVVALSQFGIDYAVATLGTASTRDHLERLFRVSRDVVFSFDGDAAGRRAAWRALETSLPFMRDGRSAKFLFMPDGLDPDDFVRANGAEAFTEAVKSATPLSQYLFDHVASDIDLGTVEGRSRLVDECRPLVERVPNGPFRELLNERLAELSKINPNRLNSFIGGAPTAGTNSGQPAAVRRDSGFGPGNRPSGDSQRPGKRRPNSQPKESGGPGLSLVRRALHLLVNDPGLASRVGGAALAPRLTVLPMPGMPLLVAVLDLLDEHPDLSTGALLEHFREDPMGQHLTRLAASPAPVLETMLETAGPGGTQEGRTDSTTALEREFAGVITRLESAVRDHRYDELAQKGAALTDAEKAEFRLLLDERSR